MAHRPTVLLHIDEKQRDMHIQYWISLWLTHCGFKTFFCNRMTRDLLWEAIKPDIMLDSHLNRYALKDLEYKSRFTKLCILPTEGAIFNKKTLTWLYFANKRDEKERVKYLAKTFLWGKKTQEEFLKTGLFKEEQLILVGNPQYDIYMRRKVKDVKSKLGMLSMFKGINVSGKRNFLQFYDDLRNLQGTHYAEDRNVEDLIWYYVCGFRTTRDLLDYLMEQTSFDVSFRPHQTENAGNYKYLEKRFNGKFQLGYTTPFFQWLQKTYAVVLCKSTTILEIVLSGVPAISIEELMGERLDDHMNLPDNRLPLMMKYAWRPRSYKEAAELCGNARAGTLPVAPTEDGLGELLNDYFGYPRSIPATYIIAQEIVKLYRDNYDFFKRKKRKMSFPKAIEIGSLLALKQLKSKISPFTYNQCFSIDNVSYLRQIWNNFIYEKELGVRLKELSMF